jgi:adenylyltransferase/sulfurtransferase
VALVVGAVEAAEVMKIVVGADTLVGNRLLVCDLWENLWRTVDLAPLAAAGCPTCRGTDYPWLEGRAGTQATVLCGRDAVQVAPSPGLAGIDLGAFAERMASVGRVVANRWIVRVTIDEGIELAVFADGRTIVTGTRDEARARGLVARYVGA